MKPRIFMMEDDEAIVTIVQEAVESQQWDFLSHPMLAGAPEALRAFMPDIVLLDLNLPDGEGYEICTLMRHEAALAKTPVIFLTSKGDIDSRLKGFAAGAQDYVVKPFNVPELLARIGAHLALKDRETVLEKELHETQLHERIRQDVIDMVVHDLRAPIATAKVTLDLIGRNSLMKTEPYARYLGYADDSLDFALFMVNDLLDLGKGKISVEVRPFDFKALVARLDKMLAVQFKAKEASLIFEVPDGIDEFVGDQALTFRILVNLLANALKLSDHGGKVTVRAARTPAGLRLEVIDAGPGIPDAEKEAVFLKFYRIKNDATKDMPGAGIGLAFCRLAAHTLRGKIWVEDAEGGGCRFILDLPALEPGMNLEVEADA